MNGMNESSRIMYLQKTISDALLSKNSIVVLDSIERMIEFVPIGPRFSTSILSSIIDILNTAESTNNLLVIGTTDTPKVLDDLGMGKYFDLKIPINTITRREQVLVVLNEAALPSFTGNGAILNVSDAQEMMLVLPESFSIGIKQLIQIIGFCSSAEENVAGEFAKMMQQFVTI